MLPFIRQAAATMTSQSLIYISFIRKVQWEFITDITPSELETRIVILRKKDQDMVEQGHL